MIDKTFTAFAPRSPRPGEALDVLSKRLWLVQKTGLRKVLIEGKRSGDTEPVHDHEGNAIRQRVRLILMLLKECPAFLKERLINVDESDGRTSQQVIANLDRLVMITTTVEKGDYLVKYVRGRNKRWRCDADSRPVATRGGMVLVFGKF